MTVDKNLFINILHRYTGSSLQEAEEVIALQSEYPYSQLLHTLSARMSKDHGFDFQQHALQAAAIHAADRAVLKEIIYATAEEEQEEPMPPQRAETQEQSPADREVRSASIQSIDSVDVADELMRDLETLNTLKHNFEMLLVEYSEVKSSAAPEDIPPAAPTPAVSEADNIDQAIPAEQPPKKATVAKDKAKSRKARIIELAKAMNAAETTQEKDHKEVKEVKVKKEQPAGPANPSDEIIGEIQSTKDEIVPESDKQREQMAIINEFIKTQPSISNAKDRTPPVHSAGDLTPIKSGEFGDNIVSETLVEILIKQGKKDKAIEVLKKLIWKYPQKKSYFAGQIEDLKK